MAYQAGFWVNSKVSLCCCKVGDLLAVFMRSNLKVLVCLPRMGKGWVSVTNMRLVSTGMGDSSPSEKVPALATTRCTMGLTQF